MLNRLATVALIFFFLQAPKTVSRQVPETSSRAQVEKKTNRDLGSSDTSSRGNGESAATKEKKGDENTPAAPISPVTITELPKVNVSVERDQYDRSYWVFSGLLVIVGGLQVGLLWRTWKTMDAQAKKAIEDAAAAAVTTNATLAAIERQAKEMSHQNKNLISKERARVTVDFPPNALDLDDGPEWTEGMNVVYAGTQITVANLGRTNAFNVTARAEIIGTPDGGALGFDEVSVLSLPAVLKPNTDPICVDVITLLNGINHVAAVKGGVEILHLAGTITYDDIFGNSHETQFRYLWEVDSRNFEDHNVYIPRWKRTAEGNRST